MEDRQETRATMSPEFVKKLERVELNYWMRYYGHNNYFSNYTSVVGGGLACAVPTIDILAMNRVLSLGIAQPINQLTLDHIIQFYKKAGSSRFFIQLPPSVVYEEIQALLVKNGLVHHNNWTKLYRSTFCPDIPINPELSIQSINRKSADIYGQLLFMSFDWQDTRLASWLASTIGQEGYRHYLVTKGGKAIAAGALFVDGEMASMAFAGTLERFRGLGAQTLLLKTRLIDAHDAGAKYITAETAQHSTNAEVKSFLNMQRFGFETAYHRQNWLFQF